MRRKVIEDRRVTSSAPACRASLGMPPSTPMTARYCAAPLVVMALAACGTDAPDTADGVSQGLAAERARRLSDVRYNLTFSIPETVDERVAGVAKITFALTEPGRALVLDFDAPPGSVQTVSAGGDSIAFTVVNDHVVVPAAALRAGEQTIELTFLAGDGALNRNDEFLYTLFVPDRASSAFPSFDQPDLKARYHLTLRVPSGWEAVANGPLEERDSAAGGETFVFGETPPLSTYLFAFAAGRFTVDSAVREGRQLHLLHRETDEVKFARNRDAVYDLHASALRWLEEYTGIAYPFPKFAFVAVPAFQYGGMEHPGAVLYRAASIFLDEAPTQNQLLGRASLIAHETAHMWFGDLVTMPWFDDVWMKEVFANFMAAKIVNPAFPDIDHDLRFFLAHHPAAYEVDRTPGANPIRQRLDNLREAGTLYGAIIYQKAPIVMRHLERLVGEEAMQDGLGIYLDRFSFSNGAWPDLIAILDDLSPDDLAAWSRAWVEEPGLPAITAGATYDQAGRIERLRLTQRDPLAREVLWNQHFDVALGYADTVITLSVHLDAASVDIDEAVGLERPDFVLPAASGLGYARIALDEASRARLAGGLSEIASPLTRSVAWQALWEAVLDGELAPDTLVQLALRALSVEQDEQIVQQILGLLQRGFWRFLAANARAEVAPSVEALLWQELERASTPGRKRAYFNALVSVTLTDAGTARLRRIWDRTETVPGLPISEVQYTTLAAALAVRGVSGAGELLDAQHERITNPDRRARFAFVMPALSAVATVRDSVFESFMAAANREREPWVLEAMRYLNHPLRAEHAERYVRPSLELVEEIQRTGDIFFPLRWLNAALDGHQSVDAAKRVAAFLVEHPDYPARLRGKILQAADGLFRAAYVVHGWSGVEEWALR